MDMFESLSLNELMRKEGFDCECGVHHSVDCRFLAIEPGAIKRLPEALRAVGGTKPFIVCDKIRMKPPAKEPNSCLLRRE